MVGFSGGCTSGYKRVFMKYVNIRYVKRNLHGGVWDLSMTSDALVEAPRPQGWRLPSIPPLR